MSTDFRATIVVPTIREDSIAEFLRDWGPEFEAHRLVVLEDNPRRTFDLPAWVEHYCWADIEARLGEQAWIIPRRTDCIRSFGYLLATDQPCDFIVTLDDDCLPEGYETSYLGAVRAALDMRWPLDRWWNTLGPGGVEPRGHPREVGAETLATCLHHGLWSGVPDLDARTQARMPGYQTNPARQLERVPTGRYFPMCGMNLAFRPEAVPALYFLLMGVHADGSPWPYDRFGDIWAGVFFKRIADHLGFAVSSGAPSVRHERASNVERNLVKETPGYPVNEVLWRRVDEVVLTAQTFKECYIEMARGLRMDGEYWDTLREAMLTWAGLF